MDGFASAAKTTPEQAAEQIVKAITKNQRRNLIGADAKFLDLLQRFVPTAYQRLFVSVRKAGYEKSKKEMGLE